MHVVYKILTNHFKSCWDYTKSTSPKLEFYHSIKSEFGKESYLDLVRNSIHRHHTTKLRISAHDLEIESGRYSNIPREERICKWCARSRGDKIIEDEKHILYDCDLYVDARNKMIDLIRRAPSSTEVGKHITSSFNINSLRKTFTNLLSQFTYSQSNANDCFTHLHSLINSKHPLFKQLFELRSYIAKFLCEYVSRCFEKRAKFIESTIRKHTSLIIQLLR